MNNTEINLLKAAGQVAAKIHQEVADLVKPGLNLLEIEQFIEQKIAGSGMEPAFRGYKGYKFVSCLSVNDEIVHGLPHDYVLVSGDLLSVDLGVKNNGFMVDTARSHAVGKVSKEVSNLLTVTADALEKALPLCRAGNTTGDLGAVIEKVVKQGNCAVVRELTGHGVGKTLQEEPSIPNHGKAGQGTVLKKGMVLAIEPITCLEKTDIALLADGWTIIAGNGLPCAHFEDTVIITESYPIVLTRAA